MSGSKGKIIFSILAVLLLLFGGGILLYPYLNGLWVEYTMHRDAEDFLLLLEESTEESQGETSYVIAGEPGAAESSEPLPPAEHTQLWLDMKAYNEAICWPSIPTISKDLKLSESTTRRALKDLRKAGLIQTEQRHRENGGNSSLCNTSYSFCQKRSVF